MTGILNGKSVIVTGSGSGLGFAYAAAAAAAGASVVVNDIDPVAIESATDAIRAAGGSVIGVRGSASDWAESESVVAACVREFGSVDGFVANAAIMHMAEPWAEEEPRLRAIAAVNVLGVQFGVGHALRAMVEAGSGGSIITVMSGAALGIAGMSAYGASKGAVVAMTHNWAIEAQPHGIRVNAISPIGRTKMSLDNIGNTDNDPTALPEPSEIAPAVVALLSDATAGVNGRLVRFDGTALSFYRTDIERLAEQHGWEAVEVARVLADRVQNLSS